MKLFLFVFVFFLQSFQVLAYGLDDYKDAFEALDSESQALFLNSAKKLKCPTCTGISVLESETLFSMQIRKKVLSLVGEKTSEADIKSYFLDHYGPWIFRAPPKEGIHLFLWLFPVLLLCLVFFMLLIFVAKKTSHFKKEKDLLEEVFNKELKVYKEKGVLN